ncbi:MAG: protein translocase subunit SecF [Proteobacteria bacterium]|jgi:preprotein translocase subunit SecF|uniref:Protein-export membrane protein SecF n=1 Tax=SAR92 bacterium BACL26 MAG-121220-bin70 TaxID=1655626 RepID=A0A0R2U786_9GAMM|nr:MAG: preprotein translocase subunit SecF [SAR92 bacterium BACL26 MAG-121220-bin70]MDA0796663.1 protein translocase subunit SecF [Pseudomonadota bacterium]MDA1352375.1 protein translocase subunit SecF [Pseudomonadota bacterium]
MTELKVYNFMGIRKYALLFSAILLSVSAWSLYTQGLELGLDFSGGTQIEVGYEQPANVSELREKLVTAGFDSPIVIHFGSETDVLIRLQGEPNQELAEQIIEVLKGDDQQVELRRVDYVGPQIGEELREDGGLGMLTALAVVMLYVAIRFQLKFSVAAVIALAHDVVITLGIFSLARLEFDLTVLAAVLAVVGYSLNDTIVVSDRIRENFRKIRNATAIEVINESLSQTLWRTINTSLTTLLVLLSLFFIGGELIHNFAIALMIGVGIGTYSSIYVAATVMLALKVGREDLLEQVEGELVDDLP